MKDKQLKRKSENIGNDVKEVIDELIYEIGNLEEENSYLIDENNRLKNEIKDYK